MTTKTTFEELATNRCVVSYTDPCDGCRITREFFAPSEGGYVRENDGQQYPQVCEELASMGNTLKWRPGHPLMDLIRREYRRMRAGERRDMADK
jgi:hypothetical protein